MPSSSKKAMGEDPAFAEVEFCKSIKMKGTIMQRGIRKLTVVGVTLAMGLVGLAGCGSQGSSNESKASGGKVYYMNFKPEVATQWEDLAKQYTDETGVQVHVQTAASNTYDQALKSEMSKTEAPTLFQVTGPVGLRTWKDYVSDISGTEPYKQLEDKSTALKDDAGHVVAVPFVTESIGIIYNKEILDKYCKLSDAAVKSPREIKSFQKLKAVADGLQKHKDELGIKGAFTSAGMDSSSNWRFGQQLAAVPLYYEFKDENTVQKQPASIKGTYLPEFKQIWDLYLKDSTVEPSKLGSMTLDDANSEFATGSAALYQNGTWAWTDLRDAGFKPENVGMIPMYIGIKGEEKQGLTTGTMNYWCINKKASKQDRKATEDFLKWVVTSDEGKKAMSEDMGFTTPFKSFADVKTDNPLVEISQKDTKSKTEKIPWVHTMQPSATYQNNIYDAMLEYAQGTGDWNTVVHRFVDGWAAEIQASKN